MEINKETMTFFSLPREIRDLIYTHLAPNNEIYSVTSANGAIDIGTFDNSEPNLNVMKICKAIQHEMLEILCRNKTIRFSFPGFDTCAKSLFHRLAPLMRHIDLYVDLGTFRHVKCHQNREIQRIGDQFHEAASVLNDNAIKCKSCRLIINNSNQEMPLLLLFRGFESLKTLVGLDTLVIVTKQWLPDMEELGVCLEPSLGPGDIFGEWFPISGAKFGHGFVKFQPRKFLAERMKYQKQLWCAGQRWISK